MDILSGAEPFRFPGGKIGCLLVHGLTGTPFEMRELGENLAKHGFTVSGVLLTGHATTEWQSLARATWEDWFSSVHVEYERLKANCEGIFVIGLSFGGSLALYLAAHNQVSGVVAMAALAYLPHECLAPLARIVSYLKPYVRKEGSSIKDPVARKTHITCLYTPLRIMYTAAEFAKRLRSDVGKVNSPTLLIYSRDDPVVSPDNLSFIYNRIRAAEREVLWLENSYHIVTRDYDKEVVFHRTVEFITRHSAS